MWIRSQDREELINTDRVYYSDVDKSINSEYTVLGMYSSKEKAMKVMDMIQNAIIGTRFEFTDIVRDCDLAGIEIHNVFNMPQDSEVKA